MQPIEEIAERIRQAFDAYTASRDMALSYSRTLTRHCAHAIRAVHRDEYDKAQDSIEEARKLVKSLKEDLSELPALYYAGYTQDALKEFAEANIVYGIIVEQRVPAPEELELEYATYLNGLAEAVGELRRRCLDILRGGHSEHAEQILEYMDEIYAILITMDYPDAITGGLRRSTDIVRGVTERTRGDLTISLRQAHLEQSLHRLENKLQEK